ncbi:MAG: MBL fold metallo-hydrolase [Actinomycetes bacterium]
MLAGARGSDRPRSGARRADRHRAAPPIDVLRTAALEALRRPQKDRAVGPARAAGTVTSPATFASVTEGIAPGDVDTVILTHLHADHYLDAVDAAGKPVFADARHVISRAEYEFWWAEPGRTTDPRRLHAAVPGGGQGDAGGPAGQAGAG